MSMPEVSDRELARVLGVHQKNRISRSLSQKLERWKKSLNALARPVIFHRKYRIKRIAGNHVELEGNQRLHSTKLARTLDGCKEAVCFIGTIGSRIEKEIGALMRQRRLSDAYVLDTVGSVSVEGMIERFHRDMKTLYKAHRQMVTLRFSPGYCDWPVTDQKPLFRLLNSRLIDVQLTDSCLMKPRKSISGIFGLCPYGDHEKPIPYHPCADCRRRDCQARRN